MAEILQMRRDTAANWTSVNPVLAQGEQGFELDSDRFKFGDGVSTWTELNYWTPSQGVTGVQGATGVQGDSGSTGVAGATGVRGINGVTGVAGAQGPEGGEGPRGFTGLQGETGFQGATGAGVDGVTGIAGVQGVTGAQGITGIQGETGVGTFGSTGLQGVTGLANFLDSTGYPVTQLNPVLLWNKTDEALFAQDNDTSHFVQISAGSLQGVTGIQGYNTRVYAWTVVAPAAGGIAGPKLRGNETVSRITGYVTSGTNATFNVQDRTNCAQTGTNVMGTDMTATASGVDSTTFSAPSLPADSYLWLQITGTSGSPAQVSVTVATTVG